MGRIPGGDYSNIRGGTTPTYGGGLLQHTGGDYSNIRGETYVHTYKTCDVLYVRIHMNRYIHTRTQVRDLSTQLLDVLGALPSIDCECSGLIGTRLSIGEAYAKQQVMCMCVCMCECVCVCVCVYVYVYRMPNEIDFHVCIRDCIECISHRWFAEPDCMGCIICA